MKVPKTPVTRMKKRIKKSLFLSSDLPGDQCAGQSDNTVEQNHGRGDAIDSQMQADAVGTEDADVLDPGPAEQEGVGHTVFGLVIDKNVER